MALIYILPKFTELPPPPNSKTQSNFNKLADQFVMALPIFQGELNNFSKAFTSQSTAVLDEINAKNDNMEGALNELVTLKREAINDLINQEKASIQAINDKGDAIIAILDGQSDEYVNQYKDQLEAITVQFRYDFEQMATVVYDKVKDLDSVTGIKDAIVDKVVENKPSLDKLGDAIADNIITNDRIVFIKYTVPTDPSTNTNPARLNHMWKNSTTGELFTCIDMTKDDNTWVGTNDTFVSNKARPWPAKLSSNWLA